MTGSEPCSGNQELLGWDMALGSSWEDLGLSGNEQQGVLDCIRDCRLTELGSLTLLLLMWC